MIMKLDQAGRSYANVDGNVEALNEMIVLPGSSAIPTASVESVESRSDHTLSASFSLAPVVPDASTTDPPIIDRAENGSTVRAGPSTSTTAGSAVQQHPKKIIESTSSPTLQGPSRHARPPTYPPPAVPLSSPPPPLSPPQGPNPEARVRGHHPRQIAKLFLQSNAPYLRHCQGSARSMEKADTYHESLNTCAKKALTSKITPPAYEFDTIAKIIDVHHRQAGPSAQSLPSLMSSYIAGCEPGKLDHEDKIDEFFEAFTSDSVVKPHTRIIVLRGDLGNPAAETFGGHHAAVRLLYAHLLGAELRMCPLDVALLSASELLNTRRAGGANSTAFRPLQHNQATFGHRVAGEAGCTVHWIDGGEADCHGRTDVVVVSVKKSWLPRTSADSWPSSAYGLFRPPPFGSPDGHNKPPEPSDPMKLLISAIEEAVRHDIRSDGELPSTHWLAAILLVEHSALCYEYEQLETARLKSMVKPASEAKGQHEDLLRHLNQYNKMFDAIQDCLDEAESLAQDAPLHHGDQVNTALSRAMAKLRRLQRMVKNQAVSLEATADQEIKLRGLQMAQLSIEESRSAIALTFLAFFFVPTNLATSVFGMNVQEVNGTGLNVWVPIVLAIVLTLVAVLALKAYRVWARWLRRVDLEHDLKKGGRWTTVRRAAKNELIQHREDIEWTGGKFLHEIHVRRRSNIYGAQ